MATTITVQEVIDGVSAINYPVTDTTKMVTLVKNIVRRAYGMRRWQFLEADTTAALTAGSSSITVSSITGALHIDAVRIFDGVNYWDLEYKPAQELRRRLYDDRVPSPPCHWTRRGDALLIYPIADKDYTLVVDYLLAAPTITSAADTFTWPPTYTDVLVQMLAFSSSQRERDLWGMNFDEQQYQERLREMEAAYGVKQRQTAATVQPWEGWGWH